MISKEKIDKRSKMLVKHIAIISSISDDDIREALINMIETIKLNVWNDAFLIQYLTDYARMLNSLVDKYPQLVELLKDLERFFD